MAESVVLILVPSTALAPEQVPAFEKSLRIYLQDFEVQVESHDVPVAPAEAATGIADRIGAQRGAQHVVVIDSQTGKGGPYLRITCGTVGGSDEERAVFTIRMPQDPKPGFFRQLGLKLRSTLWVAAMGDEPATEVPPFVAAPEPAPAVVVAKPSEAPTAHRFWLGASPAVSFAPQGLLPGLAVSTGWKYSGFGVGMWGCRSLAIKAQVEAGHATTALTTVVLGAEVRLAHDAEEWLGLWARASGGVEIIRTEGVLQDTRESRRHQQVAPILAVAADGRIGMATGIEVVLSPTLIIHPVPEEIRIRGKRVYTSGRASPGFETGMRLSF
jgi:hypothetical protein